MNKILLSTSKNALVCCNFIIQMSRIFAEICDKQLKSLRPLCLFRKKRNGLFYSNGNSFYWFEFDLTRASCLSASSLVTFKVVGWKMDLTLDTLSIIKVTPVEYVSNELNVEWQRGIEEVASRYSQSYNAARIHTFLKELLSKEWAKFS